VPNVQQTLLQFVNAVQLRLMHSLMDVAPYLVIDQIKAGAIRQPQICRMKVGIDCSRNRTVSHAQCACALFCRKIMKSCNTSRITDRATTAVTVTHRSNSRCWSSPSHRQRWGLWG